MEGGTRGEGKSFTHGEGGLLWSGGGKTSKLPRQAFLGGYSKERDNVVQSATGGKASKITAGKQNMKKPEEFTNCADRLKALADPDRLRIVNLLLSGKKNVGDIARALSEEIVNVSHHLGILRRAEIVTAEKQGRFVVYALDPRVFVAPAGPQDEPQLELGCCRLGIERD
jgi:DNA-binding transcriptional ArsR family regulator